MARQTNTEIMSGVDDAVKVKRIANNTVKYERENGDIVYRLHNTDIVTKHADGAFTLNSGGWKTVTTKDRISLYAPVPVYSKEGAWFVGGWPRSETRTPFYDGIRITAEGVDVNPRAQDLDVVKDAAKLKAKITKFVRLIDDCGELPTPDDGDCWLCMIHGEKARDGDMYDFNTVRDQSGPSDNAEHLMSHIDEGYLHGTLLVNAMRWAGYKDVGVSIYYGQAQREGKGNRTAFKNALRRYLKRKLGLV